ncbi:hypothetical protein [Streptococcus australis]|uniref:hypothetical protein n=1 Tax=Streptococcus australis TaxID=113107 RepID=UPI00189B6408|nr:hypothetical protein [Streptococcus australis]MDB8644579.1 hypothetical protein [Streptococcus australis]
MGLNFDKHREHLEKDIREALQHVFGEHFEIIDIQNIVFNAYCPTFNFDIELKDYKNKIDILIDGRDLKLYWGEERYALGYEYDCDHLNEGLRRIKAYLDQPELIFNEPVTPQNIYLKVKVLERMIESTFEGIAIIDFWRRPFEKNEPFRVVFTCLFPHYPAFFSLEIAGQQFILEEIDPMPSSIEDQAFPIHQPIDLTVSNMTSFLDWFKDSLEENAPTDTFSALTLPLDPATVEERVSQIQEIIRSTFTKDVSFMEANKLVKSKTFYGVNFSVLSEYYDARFSISLVGRHFDLHVMKPDKPDKKDNWVINGFPYLLTEENLSKVISEAEAYFARQVEPVEKKVGSTESNSEVKPSTPAPVEVDQAKNKEEALKKEYLGLRKLWKVQFLIFCLLMIAVFALEVYMGGAGYKAFKVKIRYSWISVHSFSFLFLTLYALLTLFPTQKRIYELLPQNPSWKSLSTKGVRLPKKETGWTSLVILILLLLGTIDFLSRKPEPKVENPLNYQEINNLYEEERNSHYDDIINKIQDSSGQFFEKESPVSE